MSGNDDIAKLLAGHRHGDLEAFAALVGQAARTWWPMVGAVAGSQRQMESLVRCCVVSLRRQLEDCPVDPPAFHGWVRRIALEQGLDLLERAARPGSDGEDDLSRLVAAAGLEDLREDGTGVVDGALSVPGRLGTLSGPDRALVAVRYRQGRALLDLARDSDADASVTARNLCRLRYTLDWRPDATPEALVDDGGFARTVEEALGEPIGTDLRQRLVTIHLAGNEQLIALVVRQVRMHLVLEATCRPVDADRSRRLAATVAFSPEAAFPDSDRALVPARQLSQQISIRPGGVQRRNPVIDRLAALRSGPAQFRPGTPRAQPPVQTSPLSDSVESGGTSTDQGTVGGTSRMSRVISAYHRSERATSLLLWGAVAIMAVIAWVVISRTSPQMEAVSVAPVVASQVLVQRVVGMVEAVDGDGRRHAIRNGEALQPMQKLVQQGDGAHCDLHIVGLGSVSMRGATVLRFQEGESDAAQMILMHLERGGLHLAVAGGRDGKALMVITPHGRMTAATVTGDVRCDAEGMQVAVKDGSARLVGTEDMRETVVIPGCRARAGTGRRAAVEGRRHFERGVALGGPAVTIAGERWLSAHEAEEQGMSFLGRRVAAKPQDGEPEPEPGLDLETRELLGNGITGTTADPGTVTIVQELGPGVYEIEIWLAAEQARALQDVRVLVDDRQVPIGLPLAGGMCWRRIGPCTAWVRTKALSLRIQGLVEGCRIAGITFTRVEPAP